MKLLMMRSLLLLAALGYFLAALHTYQHHHAVHAFDQHGSSAPAGQPSDRANHDCPIFTVHSLAVATLPPLDLAPPLPPAEYEAPLQELSETHSVSTASAFGARAPPIC